MLKSSIAPAHPAPIRKAIWLGILYSALVASPSTASSLTADTCETDTCTLGELMGGLSFIVGDKVFDDWETVHNRSTSSADPLETVVGAIADQPQLVRLLFDGQENRSLYAEGNDFIDFAFRFKVRATDATQRLKDVGLRLRRFQSNGGMEMTEFVYDEGGSLIDSFAVLAASPFQPAMTDVFDPREVIVVEKHIFLDGGIDDEGEPLTSFIYTFSQDFSQTPEPSTWTMLVIGVGVIAGLKYRVRRRDG